MTNNNKVIKSVSFNKTNQDEKRILDAVRRRNFSKYVKKLLLDDINKKQMAKSPTQPTEQCTHETHKESKPLTTAEQLSMLKRKG